MKNREKTVRNNRYTKSAGALLLASVFVFTISCEPDDENLDWLANTVPLLIETGSEGGGEEVEIPFDMIIDDVEVDGDGDFVFDTTRTIPTQVTVLDHNQPVEGNMVQIRLQEGDGDRVVFRASTDEEGNATGSITIDRMSPIVYLDVTYEGVRYEIEIEITIISELSRRVIFRSNNNVDELPPIPEEPEDDPNDMYPDDPERYTMVRYPSEDYYTLAFEDLYPVPGDADFNDYVVRIIHEEDLNKEGQLVRIRGSYEHVAKGAGYDHTLGLNVPELPDGSEYTLTTYGFEDEVVAEQSGIFVDGMLVLGRSNETILGANAEVDDVYAKGYRSELEIILSEPVIRSSAFAPPYDVHLNVLNTDETIHLPGKHVTEEGHDPYLDDTGFPWVLVIGGDFYWPYERQDIHEAYPAFRSWYESAGQSDNNWYQSPVWDLVFTDR